MENLSQKEIDYSNAKERVQQLKKFYAGLAIFIIVFAFYIFRKYYILGDIKVFELRGIALVFWIWGIVLGVRAVKIFFLNKDWESKMLDKELKNNRNGNH